MAAPLGLPPGTAMTVRLPSGPIRVTASCSSSTRMTEPSRIATGPSGKRRLEAITLIGGPLSFFLLTALSEIRPFDLIVVHDIVEAAGCDDASRIHHVDGFANSAD